MTMLMNAATADPFGIVGTFPEKFRRVVTSTMNGDLISERIREVLDAWEQFTDVPTGSPATLGGPVSAAAGEAVVAGTAARPYPVTPVEAVEYLCGVLQISADAALAAVDIKERTYYGWKSRPGSRPRAASLGRLWSMVEALSYLEQTHLNLAAWFHASPAAQEAFASGRVNRLVQLELEWVTARTPVTSRPVPIFGDPGDGPGDGPGFEAGFGADDHGQEHDQGEAAALSAPTLLTRRRTHSELPSMTTGTR